MNYDLSIPLRVFTWSQSVMTRYVQLYQVLNIFTYKSTIETLFCKVCIDLKPEVARHNLYNFLLV